MYLQNTIYINIDYRTDRKEHVEKELTKKSTQIYGSLFEKLFPIFEIENKTLLYPLLLNCQQEVIGKSRK